MPCPLYLWNCKHGSALSCAQFFSRWVFHMLESAFPISPAFPYAIVGRENHPGVARAIPFWLVSLWRCPLFIAHEGDLPPKSTRSHPLLKNRFHKQVPQRCKNVKETSGNLPLAFQPETCFPLGSKDTCYGEIFCLPLRHIII
jgi:hypothetical protein